MQVCEKCRPYIKELTRKQREENEELKKRVEKLERRLAAYENPHTPSSCKLIKQKPQCARKQSVPKKRGRPKGSRGTTRPFAKPTRTDEKTFDACPVCSGALMSLYQKTLVAEELPKPQPIEVVEYVENHYGCASCGEITATPENMPSRGRFGIRMLAQCTVMKFEDRLTFRKLEAAMQRTYGIAITPASIMGMTRTVSDALAAEHAMLIEKIRASPRVHADETSLRISGIRHWIWIFVTDDAVLVVIRRSRSGSVVYEILGDYKGVVICDGWKPYAKFGYTIQRCWAHLLREAKDANVNMHRALCALFADAKSGTLSRHAAEYRLRSIMSRHYKGEKIRKVMTKMNNGFGNWFTFLEHNVEPTNNTAEQALREHVIIRKIIGGLRSAAGARTHEVIMSCFATWKKLGLNVFEALLIRLRS